MKKTAGLILFLILVSPHYLFCHINIGDTLQFWSTAYIDWQPDPPIEQRIINAVCKSIGNECYVFVDIEVNNPPTEQQINSLVNNFDTDFVPNLTSLYGPVPDEFDNDPRIYILIIPNEGWTGYFDPAHQMADSLVWQTWTKHSNQMEIIYITPDAFPYSADLVLAHEFGHMLHWGRDHSPEPPGNPVKYWEDAWIDEGFATFAPVYLLEDINQEDVYDSQAFFSYYPDLSLIYFTDGASYNQAKLWMTFMWEHFGQENFISTLINDQANGIEGVVNTLNSLNYEETFDETFEQWIIANYLDNKNYLDGKYGYFHYNFPACLVSAVYYQLPTGIKTGSVSSYAADYIQFSSTTPRDISIHFDGVDTTSFRLAFLKLGTSNSQVFSVEPVLLDSLNSASFYFDSLGIDVKKIIMVVMNTDASLGENQFVSYTYGAESILDIKNDQKNLLSYVLYQNYPNPFNPSTVISYQLPEIDNVTLKVYDVLGNEITTLVDEYKPAGNYQISFDASELVSGIYFYTLIAGKFSETKKMILMR
jgi:hypothetical protein